MQPPSDLNGGNPAEDKVIVFSTWTTTLDLLEVVLQSKDISFRRLDGKCSLQEREAAVENMRDDPANRVFLV